MEQDDTAKWRLRPLPTHQYTIQMFRYQEKTAVYVPDANDGYDDVFRWPAPTRILPKHIVKSVQTIKSALIPFG